jgi:hypothetical protein
MDPGTAEVGGRLPVSRCDVFVEPFAEVACTAPLDEPRIVQTVFGWHLVVVHDRKERAEDISSSASQFRIEPFQASITLSCSFESMPGQAIVVRIDEASARAFVEKRKALLFANDVSFTVLTQTMRQIRIDRTSGRAVAQMQGERPMDGLICRPSSQRLF